MAVTATFAANFSSFYTAVQKAEVQLKSFETGAGKVEKSLNRMTDQFSGRKVIQEAALMERAIAEVGGLSKLTQRELQGVGTKAQEAIAKMKAIGVVVPPGLQAIADKAKAASGGFQALVGVVGKLGTEVATMAAGFLSAQAIWSASRTLVSALASGFKKLTLEGAAVADVADNFARLTTQAGLLGQSLLGTLRQGTHATITDFELMKTVNQDLAAGMRLTDAQFGTLSKGAFALAQATGTDVKSAFDTMNDAMLTGRTRALALLTGKIDLEQAEEAYAKSLGSTREHLTEEGKLEAARVAILNAVGEATARLGEQTDGLDEKVQQAQVAWQNFEHDLGQVVATSEVLIAGLDGIGAAVLETFGGSREQLIQAVAHAIDEAAIKVVEFAQVGVTAAGFLVKEFLAVQKVFGNLTQIIEGNVLALEFASLGVAKALGRSEDVKRINANIDSLLISMKRRGEALQEADRIQSAVDANTGRFNTTLQTLHDKMVAARDAQASFVGPLQETVRGTAQANTVTERRAGLLKQTTAELNAATRAEQKRAEANQAAYLAELAMGRQALMTSESLRGLSVTGGMIADSFQLATEKMDGFTASTTQAAKFDRDAFFDMGRVALPAMDDLTKTLAIDWDAVTTHAKRALQQQADKARATYAFMKAHAADFSTATIAHFKKLAEQADRAIDGAHWTDELDALASALARLAQISGDSFGGIVKDIANVVASLALARQSIEDFKQAATKSDKLIAGVGAASSFLQATGSGSTAARTAGGALVGAEIGAQFGPIGAGIGAAAGALTGFLRGLLGVSEAVKKARSEQDALIDGFRQMGFVGSDFDVLAQGIGDTFRDIGKDGEEARRILEMALDTDHPERYAEALREINAALAEQKSRWEGTQEAVSALNDFTQSGIDTQGKFELASGSAIAIFDAWVKKTGDVVGALQQIGPTLDSLATAEETFGFAGGEAIEQLMHLRDVAEANKPLMDNISQSTRLLQSLGKAGLLTQDLVMGFGQNAVNQFELLKQATGKETEALALMQPELQTLWEHQQKFGDITDEATLALLHEAEVNGVVGEDMKDVQQQTLDVLKAIAKVLGADIPGALAKLPTEKTIEVNVEYDDPGFTPDYDAEAFHAGGLVEKFHQGGVIDRARTVLPFTRDVKRFHDGGLIDDEHRVLPFIPRAHMGLAVDEVPIIAQTGEGILNRGAMKRLGGATALNALNAGGSWAAGPVASQPMDDAPLAPIVIELRLDDGTLFDRFILDVGRDKHGRGTKLKKIVRKAS